MAFDFGSYAWFLLAVQVFGVASALLARLSVGSPNQRTFQGMFFIGLVLVGLAAMAQLVLETSSCMLSGTVLSAMVLAATCDFSTGRTPAAE